MKKLTLTLASLLAVSAIASAKEVVPAPVAAVEPTVVYVATTPAWRPSGYVDLGYRYYGADEFDSPEYGRVQMQGKFNFTEKDRVEYRFRRYNYYQTQDHQFGLNPDRLIGGTDNASQARLRYFYENGNLGDTKISLTQRLQYENGQSTGQFAGEDENGVSYAKVGDKYQNIEYRLFFEYAEYMTWTPEWFKNTSATIQPYVGYSWTDADSSSTTEYGIQLGSTFDLPYGFSTEFNLYPAYVTSNHDSSEWTLAAEAYLYYGYNLFDNDKYAVDFNFEGGMDPYVFHTDRKFGKAFSTSEDASYSAYAMPSLDFTYTRTENMKIYAGVAAEYRNWRQESQNGAKNWTWMPQVYAGLRLDF